MSDQVRDAIKRTADRLLAAGIHRGEARLIAKTYRAGGCDELLDLGCSTGVLAYRILELVKPKRYVGFDANPFCVEHTLQLLRSSYPELPITVTASTIIPDHLSSKTRVKGKVNDLVNTSSVYTTLPGAVEFDSPPMTVQDIVRDISPSTFLKIDIDGVDVDIISELIRSNRLPRAFQFELQPNQVDDVTLPNILRELAARGYMLPELSFLRSGRFCEITASAGYASAVVFKERDLTSPTGFQLDVWESS